MENEDRFHYTYPMKREERLRNRLFFIVFLLFAILVALSVLAIFFLIRMNLVSLAHTRTLGDLKLAQMYLDIKAPGAWEIRSGSLYKGSVSVSRNMNMAAELSRYLPHDSVISLEIGDSSEPHMAKSQRLTDQSPLTRWILFSIRLDPRFSKMSASRNGQEAVGAAAPSFSSGAAEESAYLTMDGMAVKLFDASGKGIGWLKIKVGDLEPGVIENWILWVLSAGLALISGVILILFYIVLYRLSVPIMRLAEVNKTIVKKNENLKSLTRSDPLTSLLNRRGFEEVWNDVRKTCRSLSHALAILDLDNFKAVNDTYGHSCGDFVLVRVAALIQKGIRRQDVACRWGGEEFLVCYPDITPDIVSEAAERLRVSIAAFPVVYEGKWIPITVTIGTALFQDDGDFEEALKRADAALYRGKREGKNRVESGDDPVLPST